MPEQWVPVLIVGLVLAVLAPLTKDIGAFVAKWFLYKPLEFFAKAVVKEINGQLGLPELRDEVGDNTQATQILTGQITNLEKQIERHLIDERRNQ